MRGGHLFEREMQDRALDEFDDLKPLKKLVDWEGFREPLQEIFGTDSARQGPGRPPWDELVMFRALLLGVMYSLSDRKLQHLLLDRRSFNRFVGLESDDRVPDEKTLWKYRNQLSESGRMEELFKLFREQIEARGYELTSGRIVDSTMVEVPRQRNSRADNETVKSGEVPEDWQEKPNKLRQKDVDARWTKKNNETYYGYKNHVAADRDTKFIADYGVTEASRNDHKVFDEFLPEHPEGEVQVWADSAYRSEDRVKDLRARGYKPRINFKGTRAAKLTRRQKELNRSYSSVRARVEHVFGAMHMEMPEHTMRCIGIKRAECWIGLRNLCYNIRRMKSLQPSAAAA